MNIVKFKDVIIDNDELFNTKFKGKYCYVLNWIYCISFDDIDSNEYISISRGENDVYVDYILFTDYKDYVDVNQTEKVNRIENFRYLNNFSTDDDVTIDELKRFRTWLADELYINKSFIEDYADDTDKLNHMLMYYKEEMYDDTIKSLLYFVDEKTITTSLSLQSGCGCGNTLQYDIRNADLNICNPISIYRSNIYTYMTKIFSDINYWIGQKEICIEMKKYIDGIIKTNFPLTSSISNRYDDCVCLNINNNEQEVLMNILKQLSVSLGYIVEDNVSGNRNFIITSFTKWATQLYEKMRW